MCVAGASPLAGGMAVGARCCSGDDGHHAGHDQVSADAGAAFTLRRNMASLTLANTGAHDGGITVRGRSEHLALECALVAVLAHGDTTFDQGACVTAVVAAAVPGIVRADAPTRLTALLHAPWPAAPSTPITPVLLWAPAAGLPDSVPYERRPGELRACTGPRIMPSPLGPPSKRPSLARVSGGRLGAAAASCSIHVLGCDR